MGGDPVCIVGCVVVQMEVVQKASAMRWVEAAREPDSAAGQLFAQDRTQKFVAWLRSYDEDDEDSESSEDEESGSSSEEEEESD